MLTLYRILLYLALPYVVIRLLLRALRDNSYFARPQQRFGFSKIRPAGGGIWIHAVSVGEVNAIAPLVKTLMQRYPQKAITVTTMTATGSHRVQALFGGSVSHCYLPYDYQGAVKRFLQTINPCLGIVMETEIWPNLIDACYHNNIQLIYANVRMSARSFNGYRRFARLLVGVFAKVDAFAMQSEADAKRLLALGAPAEKISVTGSIKFDLSMPPSVTAAGASVRRQLGTGRSVLLAASTHDGEEAIVLAAFDIMRKQIPELLLLLAPRHPERCAAVQRGCQKQRLQTLLWSNKPITLAPDIDVLVVDTIGQLTCFIAASDVVFMAGSLVPVGGHNLLEAAALAKPAVFGPYMFNFEEIAKMFVAHHAGIQIQHPAELADVIAKLLLDPVARDKLGSNAATLLANNRGALDRLLKVIARVVN